MNTIWKKEKEREKKKKTLVKLVLLLGSWHIQ
jgi:hypothetical protein